MCTCPNYMIYSGNHIDKDLNEVPSFKFCGHHQFEKIYKGDLKLAYIQVPCGKCLECRIQQTRQWSDRCVLESKNSEHNYFVTLTYDDAHLPPNCSLEPDDLNKFIDRLRKRFKRAGFNGKIRYLASGEYGSTSLRPHFHILLFNCPLNDLSYEFYQEVDGKMVKHIRPPSKNDDIYFSKTIYDLWSIPIYEEGYEGNRRHIIRYEHKGMISVGHFSYDTAAYVAQYVTKKVGNKFTDLWKSLNLRPEFIRMSNGIGKQYFIDHPDAHDFGKLVIDSDGEAHLASIPRYFDKLFIKKYGRTIFEGSIGARRSSKRIINIDTNLHKGVKYDEQCAIREEKVKRVHHLKQGL